MRIWPIYKKELVLYFTSPVAYVLLTIFLFITGLFFYAMFSGFADASMQVAANPGMARDFNVNDSVLRGLFDNMRVILLLIMPLVTMRLFAEERRSGTLELLLTDPVRDGAVLIGKYLAALTLYSVMIGAMLAYPLILSYFAHVEWGSLFTGYIGLLLMGAMFAAVGLFASSLTENQIVAAVVAFGILLSFWIIGWLANFVSGPVGAVLTHLSLLEHNDTFAKGVLDTKDVIYYLDFIALALFLALRSLESRRWRG
jgi:ABC-2 type transport system permease protein